MFTIKLFLSLLPIVIIGIAIYKIDVNKEPKEVLRNIFIGSIIVGLVGGTISYFLTKYLNTLTFNSKFVYNVVRYLFVVALIEEICKYIPAKYVGMKSKYYSSFFDTLIYFTFSGLGFACIENIMYVMTFTAKTALVRGILSVPCHILFSLILGIFIALANKEKLKNNNKTNEKVIIYTTLGFTISSISHALFNYTLSLKIDIVKAIIVTLIYLIGVYFIFILKETSRVETFYIKNILFKKILEIDYIKANSKFIGLISSLIIILGVLNTFSVYVFVEKDIVIKYILLIIQLLFGLSIIYRKSLNKKINNKYLNITNIVLYSISVLIYIFLLSNHLDIKSKLDYGYILSLIGILLQLTYFVLNIKLKNKIVNNKEQEPTKKIDKEEKDSKEELMDSEII